MSVLIPDYIINSIIKFVKKKLLNNFYILYNI